MRKGMRVEGRVLISPFALCCLFPQLPYGQVPLHTPCIFPYVCLAPLILTQAILSHDFLPFCLSAYSVCQTVPPFHPCSDCSLPLVSAAPIPDDRDFDVLCLTLQFSSHCMEGSNSKHTGSVLCSACFHKCPSSLGFKVLGRRGRRMGVSPPPSLSFRLLKQRMAIFMQTKIGSLNVCLHLSNSLLIIADAVQEAATQNHELNVRCGSSL